MAWVYKVRPKSTLRPPEVHILYVHFNFTTYSRLHYVQSISFAFKHCVLACVDAWLIFVTKRFTDKYGMHCQRVPIGSVLVREAFCHEIEPRIATRKHTMFKRK